MGAYVESGRWEDTPPVPYTGLVVKPGLVPNHTCIEVMIYFINT